MPYLAMLKNFLKFYTRYPSDLILVCFLCYRLFLANKRRTILPTVYGLPDHGASSVGTTTVPFIRSTKSPATVVALAGEAVT